MLLPRPSLGSKASNLLRKAGFIPGTVRLGAHLLPIIVCAKLINRLPYKQQFNAILNGRLLTLTLSRYQLDPISFEIQHIEYCQHQRALTCTLTRILLFNATNCAAVRSGAKFKMLQTRLNLVGESSLAPNYIKADISECVKGDDVVLTCLRYKRAQFVTSQARNVLATIR
ncbi:MAG: hypothetical protein AAI978_00750 [Candidatus Hodgkinia cicadicola]